MVKIEYDNFVINAKLHGAEIKEGEASAEAPINPSSNTNNPLPLFRDPKEYEKMSEKERQELTKTMMDGYKNWSSSAINKKG